MVEARDVLVLGPSSLAKWFIKLTLLAEVGDVLGLGPSSLLSFKDKDGKEETSGKKKIFQLNIVENYLEEIILLTNHLQKLQKQKHVYL